MERLRVPVHYDFASTLCHVAHHVMERMQPLLDRNGLELYWTPLDLSRIVGYRRGGAVPEARRAEMREIARQLDVDMDVPAVWHDSRALAAAAIAAEAAGREVAFRHRGFVALFEEHRSLESDASVIELARDVGLELDGDALGAGRRELEERTLSAHRAEVSGVPTFMLGSWPFGGIQTEDTMARVLERFAQRARRNQRH
ncbi:MAG: DsbA family protein [Myxococcota bacterium]|nr:DsbA family protein [Myxococcota bacterium]